MNPKDTTGPYRLDPIDLSPADPNHQLLIEILDRALGIADSSDAKVKQAHIDGNKTFALEPWEKIHVLTAVFNRVLDQPLLAFVLVTGMSFNEAFAAHGEYEQQQAFKEAPLTGGVN